MMQSVDRSTAVLVAVGLVCVAGLGMAAATINSANPVGASDGNPIMDPPSPRDSVEVGGETGAAAGDGHGTGGIGQSYGSLTTCVPLLDSTVGLLATLAAVLSIAGLIYYRYNFALALFSGWTVLPPAMLGYFLVTDCGGGGGSMLSGAASGMLSGPGEGLLGTGSIPTWAMGLFGVAVIGGAIGLLYRTAGTDEVVDIEEESTTEDVELDDFAAAAGRAADRIEEHNQDADNAVYEAWVEMTELLDVDSPETYSPGEFADAAVDAGMDQADVRQLTRLFNEVRYGERDVDSREDQAVDVLRNIESQYSETNQTDATETAVDSLDAGEPSTNSQHGPDHEPEEDR